VISHKPVAVAAGLGVMGIHRNVIHPRFGNFVLLGTVVTDLEPPGEATPLDFNPCLECKLCVAACPVGAISQDGAFAFDACYTHNYREFMSGFTDWVETVVEAGSAEAYRARVNDGESASIWQSLAFGPNYKAAYCMAVCPAGEDVIGPFLESRRGHLDRVVRPLQAKVEPVYVVAGSDAERHVKKRFPHKVIRRVRNGLRVRSVKALAGALPRVFQPGAAGDLAATFNFVFRGREDLELCVVIREGTIQVSQGLAAEAELTVDADSETWIGFLAKERSILWALATRRVRVKGPLSLLQAFGRCFP
jgi:ferredoxin